MSEKRLIYLFERHLAGNCTPEEKLELSALALTPGMEGALKNLVEQAWEITGEAEDIPEYRAEAMLDAIIPGTSKAVAHPGRKAKYLLLQRIALAASILLITGLGIYFLFFNKTVPKTQVVQTPAVPVDIKPPEFNRATVILANGQKVYLDSVANGTLAVQDNYSLVKKGDGTIEYYPGAAARTGVKNEIVYNTFFNPKGSKVINLTLSDGSRVWLNAASSIRFPVAFGNDTRTVEISGEAYFEVRKDATKKFVVISNGIATEVLGTHFNVNAYDDEDAVWVTLLEGSVKVKSETVEQNPEITLRPGEQAIIETRSSLTIDHSPNLEEVMAWKNGRFEFSDTDIQTIMRQISRWYNVEIVFEEPVSQHFYGTIPRNVNVSRVLSMLEKTGGVRFSIDGKKVTVKKH